MRKHPHVYSASISTIRLSAIWVFIPLIRTLGLLDLKGSTDCTYARPLRLNVDF